MKMIILLSVLCFSMASCDQKEVVVNEVFDVFNKEQVAVRVTGNREKQNKAMQGCQLAIQKFRKENNPMGAIPIFEASLADYPFAKTYFEMGNAFASGKYYDSAIRCYHMAEQMGFSPVSKVFYNLACAYSLKDQPRESGRYLEYAIEAGYLNKTQFAMDSDLTNLRRNGFTRLLASALDGVENPDNVVWEGFLNTFTPIVLPVTLDFNTSKTLNEGKYLSYSFEKYVSEMHKRERFSRGPGDVYYANGIVDRNSEYIAVVYTEVPESEMGDEEFVRYYLVTYSKQGKLIDKMQIGGQVPLQDSFKMCTISPNLSFEVRYFTNTYNSREDEDGVIHKDIATSELKGAQYFMIAASGKFSETSAPMGKVDTP